MNQIKGFFKLFLREPMWFKVLILATFISSIVFSSTYFSHNPLFESIAKGSAAVFFCTFGLKYRRNLKVSVPMFIAAILCVYLSYSYIGSI